MAQAREPSWRATTMIAMSTARAMPVMTQVLLAPSDRAAPGLPMSLKRMNSPMNGRDSPSSRTSSATIFVSWSLA